STLLSLLFPRTSEARLWVTACSRAPRRKVARPAASVRAFSASTPLTTEGPTKVAARVRTNRVTTSSMRVKPLGRAAVISRRSRRRRPRSHPRRPAHRRPRGSRYRSHRDLLGSTCTDTAFPKDRPVRDFSLGRARSSLARWGSSPVHPVRPPKGGRTRRRAGTGRGLHRRARSGPGPPPAWTGRPDRTAWGRPGRREGPG